MSDTETTYQEDEDEDAPSPNQQVGPGQQAAPGQQTSSDFSVRASYLGDFASQQRTQVAMCKEANYIIGTTDPTDDTAKQRLQLSGKMLRAATDWASVVYAHITSIDPGAPVSSMNDATLSAACGNAINDLAKTEVLPA